MIDCTQTDPDISASDIHYCEQQRDKLNDFRKEFKRLKKGFVEAQNRYHLLDSVEQDIG